MVVSNVSVILFFYSQIWYVGGGDTTKYFRPRIDEKSLAGDSAAKIGMIKVCRPVTHEIGTYTMYVTRDTRHVSWIVYTYKIH